MLEYESKPIFKKSIMGVGLPGRRIFCPFAPPHGVLLEPLEPWQRELVQLFDGERTVKELGVLLAALGHTCSSGEVRNFCRELDAKLLLEDMRDEEDDDYPQEGDRYQRQRLFFGAWEARGFPHGREMQRRLEASRVVLFGVGGGGCQVLQNLTALGVGHLTLVEFDRVTPSNLNRQILYGEEDLGCSKIEVLRRELPRKNSRCAYTFREERITSSEDFARLLRGHDLGILTADSPRESIFSWFNQGIYESRTPGLYTAGVTPASLGAGPLVIPGETPCYDCSLPPWKPDFSSPEVKALNGRYQHGVLAPHVAILGGILALEAVRFLTGFQEPLTKGARLELNLFTWESRRIPLAFRERCPWCGA
jgi:molybdopterin/thiamine biosynthesis adenylyltransferase